MDNVVDGYCVPFLGPRVTAGLVADRARVARGLARKYGYPFAGDDDLARVAQCAASIDAEATRRRYLRVLAGSLIDRLGLKPSQEEKTRLSAAGLTSTIAELRWAERAHERQEMGVEHGRAELGLPLDGTTTADRFMAEALARQGVKPRREGPRWSAEPDSPPTRWIRRRVPSCRWSST